MTVLSLPTDAPASASRSTNVFITCGVLRRLFPVYNSSPTAHLGTQHHAYQSPPSIKVWKHKHCLHISTDVLGSPSWGSQVFVHEQEYGCIQSCFKIWYQMDLCSSKMLPKTGSCFQPNMMDTNQTSLNFSIFVCKMEPIIPASRR